MERNKKLVRYADGWYYGGLGKKVAKPLAAFSFDLENAERIVKNMAEYEQAFVVDPPADYNFAVACGIRQAMPFDQMPLDRLSVLVHCR